MSDGPFSGLLVLDLTRVLAGPFCTMMLAELGARVVKVEPPGGDDSRRFEPMISGRSAYFASLNRGKESIVLDLKAAADRELFLRMAGRADVLVENYRPGTLDRLGLGWDVLHERNPRLVYACVSGFGHTGPWSRRPAYDLVVQALSGLMSVTGPPGGPATRAGTSIADITGGMFTLAGVAAALFDRCRTGVGRKVDVAMLDGQLAVLESAVVRYTVTGAVPAATGNRHPSIAPFAAYRTADRPLVIAAGNDPLFRALCGVLGRPALADDPRFVSNGDRVRNADALEAELEQALRKAPAAHWLAALEAAGIPCAPIQDVAEAVEHPQTRARNMIVRAGDLRVAGNPVKLSGVADPPDRRVAPDLDADGERLRQEFAAGG
jgi:CoA:oxalate CoA-transferase